MIKFYQSSSQPYFWPNLICLKVAVLIDRVHFSKVVIYTYKLRWMVKIEHKSQNVERWIRSCDA